MGLYLPTNHISVLCEASFYRMWLENPWKGSICGPQNDKTKPLFHSSSHALINAAIISRLYVKLIKLFDKLVKLFEFDGWLYVKSLFKFKIWKIQIKLTYTFKINFLNWTLTIKHRKLCKSSRSARARPWIFLD